MKSAAQKHALGMSETAPDLFGRASALRLRLWAGRHRACGRGSPGEGLSGLAVKAFEFHGHLGNRRIVSYGHRYDYPARTLRNAEPMPEFLKPLKQTASQLTGIPVQAFQQALVTEYAPGAGIGWHRDKPMFEHVVGFSFLAPCTLRLRRKADTGWERKSVALSPRSAYLLRAAVREDWEHSIAPMDVLRYSVTLRTFKP